MIKISRISSVLLALLVLSVLPGINRIYSQINRSIPYPIIFVHGLNSNGGTWNGFIDNLKLAGLNDGGTINITLDYNRDTASIMNTTESDVHLFEGGYEKGDLYRVNFNVRFDGSAGVRPDGELTQDISAEDAVFSVKAPEDKNTSDYFKIGDILCIENEYMVVKANSSPPYIGVKRGLFNSQIVPHSKDKLWNFTGTIWNLSQESNQSSIAKQGWALKKAIDKVIMLTGAPKVILVGHSMGGLAIREYLRSQNYFQNDVIKVVTIGTPHLGSKVAELSDFLNDFLVGVDGRSDAIRDLSYNYNGTNGNPEPPFNNDPDNGVFLFGGDELYVVSETDFHNPDINANGIMDNSLYIPGMSKDLSTLPSGILYSWIVSDIPGVDGDGCVRAQRQFPWYQKLNENIIIEIGDTLRTNKPHIGYMLKDYQLITGETDDYYSLMRGLDEPGDLAHAYQISPGSTNRGFISAQPNFITDDVDAYKINFDSDGTLNIQLGSMYAGINKLELLDENCLLIKEAAGEKLLNISDEIHKGTYYIRVYGKVNADSWQFSYSLQNTFTPAPVVQSPVLFSPANNVSDISIPVLFKWLRSDIAASYRFQLSDRQDFSNAIIDRSNVTDTLFWATVLSNNTMYFWRVKAYYSVNGGPVYESGWSEAFKFTTSDGIPKEKIAAAECFIDFDPGPDKRIKIPVNLLSDVSCTQTLDIKYLEDGIHTLFVRVKDDQDKWSQIFSKVFIKVPSENGQLRNIVKLRYSIDAPVDEMHALYAAVTPGRDIQSIFNAALTGLPEGIHKIHVQALDEKGINSLTFSKEFIKQHIPADAAANIVQMEYFTDNDPGQGMAEKVNFIPADSISMNVILPLTGLSNGIHTIHVRCKNGSGVWSLLFSRVFIKSSLSSSLSTEISKIGYFISADDYLSEIKYCNNIIKSQNGEFSFTADLTGLMTDSVYNLHIFVMDNSGLSSQMYSKEFLIKVTSQSYKILVEKGWNLISVPESSHDQKITDLFTNAVSDAWYFTGSYTLGDMTEQGKGFWLKYAKSDTISFVSDRKADSIKVKAGWNIIGGLTENISQYSLRTIPDNIFTSSFYSFRNNTGYLTEDSLVTGKGYWIRASREGTIFLNPNSSQKYSPAGIAAKDPDWKGRITVTDKNGNCKTLYITATNQSLSSFDLPPVPPEGIFDVRWSTDRSAESAGAKCMVISSAGYPVTIKLEGISASIKDISGGRTINKLLKAGESFTISNPSAERLQVEEAEIPLTFELYQNYPNPFNPSTKITYTLAKDSHVTLKIYNALGELVQQLSDEIRPSGPNEITFNAIHLSSGIYFYELNAHSTDGSKTFKNVKKFLLLK